LMWLFVCWCGEQIRQGEAVNVMVIDAAGEGPAHDEGREW
jgi:hypothetical protein